MGPTFFLLYIGKEIVNFCSSSREVEELTQWIYPNEILKVVERKFISFEDCVDYCRFVNSSLYLAGHSMLITGGEK